MVEIDLKLNENVNQNAEKYFSKSKKLKAKLPGLEEAILNTKKQIKEFEEKKEKHIEKKEFEEKVLIHKKKEWYEKFRYTFTENGLLVVLGKDAGTNEVLVKKHLEENDIVFHTEAPGSPFAIVKGGRDKLSKSEIEGIAQVVASFSSQWKRGFGTADAFWVYSEQISKKAQSGEFISKGSFMVRGEKHIVKNIPLKICLGVFHEKLEIDSQVHEFDSVISGYETMISKKCKKFVKMEPGDCKYKALNKEIKKRLGITVEDLPKFVPNEVKVLKK